MGDVVVDLLAGLKDQGAAHFDPAGWHYLDTLARHAEAHEGSVRRLLEAKLERAVAAFSERLETARSAAAELLDAACRRHPQAAAELQQLFAASDFKGLRYCLATLEAREHCAALTGLVSQLEPGQSPGAQALSRATAADSPALDLKTVRESRATWARISVDRQLSLAMKQAPANAGPINSHMLVLRSLAMMQAISPDYLNHFVSYVDTLLSLGPVETEVPARRKKAAPAKAAKSAKVVKTSPRRQ
ncbi:DUF2894 domain-containing protein [Massilia soli]|uniref:DUF2894 domain-containing protein n=1 Tax=Massilia soli TaxID=2792854 RepID=A0ABS7SVP5_9BURK|nr:DUF2894 domain-containing protein [Massilia soli]MBZ2209999.1 DUF2894 domain-containing protein [Massilia soli]